MTFAPLGDDDLATVEAALGHNFADRELLRLAMTHSSTGLQRGDALATLGDLIHGVWAARRVFSAIPSPTKGRLTSVVNGVREGRRGQAAIFRTLGIDAFVVLGGATRGHGGIVTEDMAATTFEAIVAAIELDGGQAAAVAFLDRVGAAQIDAAVARLRPA